MSGHVKIQGELGQFYGTVEFRHAGTNPHLGGKSAFTSKRGRHQNGARNGLAELDPELTRVKEMKNVW